VNITKVNRPELAGINERLDIFLGDSMELPEYTASLEIPLSLLDFSNLGGLF
jgi:hypothetical protein